jgi:hypothetical protein
MESILMFSIRDLNRNVILFVGRPSDLRKGLALLFEAVEVLTTLTDLPAFALWIVGGSPREVNVVACMINRIRSLSALHQEGRILLWGRVENVALSELYSRASVTVVPSYREEFGIVAVEAMMSGCPVVAARTGGLQDIVGEEESGTLFDPDDALALAATLCGYLRNPQQRKLHCEAARRRAVEMFSSHKTLSLIEQVYNPTGLSDSNTSCWEQPSSHREQLLTPERLSRLNAVFKDESISITPASYGKHPVFEVESRGAKFVAKFFTQRFSLQASLFPNSSLFHLERGGKLSYNRVLYNMGNPVAPAIYYFEENPEPLIVSEWAEQLSAPLTEDLDDLIHQVIRRCQEHQPLPDCAEMDNYVSALSSFAERPDEPRLARFDLASAQLNSRMTGGMLVLCRTHPQVELFRFRELLNKRVWPVPEEFRIRATQVIDLLLETEEIIVEKPVLAHADPKPEHLLKRGSGEILLTDFEHSRYGVGPMDLSLWFTITDIRDRDDSNSSDYCHRLCRQFESSRESYLCVCWVVAEMIFFPLQRFSLGKRREMQIAQRFMRDLGLALLNGEIIR